MGAVDSHQYVQHTNEIPTAVYMDERSTFLHTK